MDLTAILADASLANTLVAPATSLVVMKVVTSPLTMPLVGMCADAPLHGSGRKWTMRVLP
jgi:hypothetical protein